MNIQHLRHSLKVKWLLYYRQNRPWMRRLKIWGTYDGQRRPSSSFILAILSTVEPQLIQLFPFVIDLSNNPDRIVAALGLNFNPDEELKSLTLASGVATTPVTFNNGNGNGTMKTLPAIAIEGEPPPSPVTNLPSWVDESCIGVGGQHEGSPT